MLDAYGQKQLKNLKKKVSTLQTNQYQKHLSTQQSIPRTLFGIEFNPVQET